MNAATFYEQAQPLAEQLLTMARTWREQAPTDPEAIRAHSDALWLSIRMALRLRHAQEQRQERALLTPRRSR